MNKIVCTILIAVIVIAMPSCQSKDKKGDDLWNKMNFKEAVKCYEESARDGSAYAKWRLSKAYSSGRGVEYNVGRALELLKYAATHGCEEAQCDLGIALLYEDYGLEQDEEKGVALLNKLWQKTNNTYCLARQARELIYGWSFNKDINKAFEILDKIKKNDNGKYYWLMGEIYIKGTDDIDIDWEKAIEYLEKAFDKGEFASANIIGSIYRLGPNDSIRNLDKAMEWYKKGVRSKDVKSMVELAKCCISNDTVFRKWRDFTYSIHLFERAGNLGSGEAYDQLGNMYLNGYGVTKNDVNAFQYFEKAAYLKYPIGINNLGALYYDGIGCEKDVEKAISLYEYAAELGSGRACKNLYWYYYNTNEGDIHKRDLELAKEYLLKAAETGDEFGLVLIGQHYYYGSDIFKEDKYQAFRYYKQAADKGNTTACNNVSYMYRNGIGTDEDHQKAKEYLDKTKAKSEDLD